MKIKKKALLVLALAVTLGIVPIGLSGCSSHSSKWGSLSEQEKQNARDAYQMQQWVDEQKGK